MPDFFESRKAAAVFKHGILSRYPVVFASKTGKAVEDNRVVFLDGYAGRGEYEDGQPGSPLPNPGPDVRGSPSVWYLADPIALSRFASVNA